MSTMNAKRKRNEEVNQESEQPKQKYILLYPITRYYHNVYSSVEFDELPTKKRKIMKFYQKVISEQDRRLIYDAYMNNDGANTDYFASYIFSDEENEPSKDPKLKYKHMMGGLQWYEGLEKISDYVYRVQLGS